MTTAYYSTVLDHPVDTVWSLIRDFNNYPAYIEGVTESVIEDGRRGDEVGAVRRFCYRGNWIRQRLGGHSDKQRLLCYVGIDPLKFPAELCIRNAIAGPLRGRDASAPDRGWGAHIHRVVGRARYRAGPSRQLADPADVVDSRMDRTLCEGRWNWRVMPPIKG